jgi:hypothetical protein
METAGACGIGLELAMPRGLDGLEMGGDESAVVMCDEDNPYMASLAWCFLLWGAGGRHFLVRLCGGAVIYIV